ncbi:MAG TPA: hypothetical protein PLD25_14705 [Chloroflexota bacterium]|nr:hypothetical protein [Chloroflexota bacterium]HUM67618.1 hypothetical protein [Chloroflexota bacterium]
MFAYHFRRFLVLCVVVGLVTAVLIRSTAVTAQQPAAPPAPDERTLLPQLPAGEEEEGVGNTILGAGTPSWSKGVFQSFRDNNWEIYRYDYNAPSAVRLTAHASTDMHPRLNRGATRIVFSSNRDGDYEIFVMNANGSGVQQLTHNGTHDVNPIWSPDGSRIAFQSYRDGQSEIYVMNADGSGQARLTAHGAYDGDPAWSPDGSKIAFRSNRAGTPFIYVMNSNGSGVVQLSSQPSFYVAWSPDGSQLAYSADLDGDDFFELWLMNADGSNQQMHIDPYGQTDAWVRGWSADGRAVLFTEITFVFYQGNWYWQNAYIKAYDTVYGGNYTYMLEGDSRNWNPDWQTTDVIPPQTETGSMFAFSQIADFWASWSGTDQLPEPMAGLAAYDVQYRVGSSGPWVDWQMGVTTTSALYTAVPGATVSFRARARDNAFNVEEWSAGNNQTTTFYTWSLGGKLTDNRGAPITQAPLVISPPPLNEAITDNGGSFFSRLKTAGAHTLDVNRTGYGDLAQTSLNMENLAHIYLPPANDALLNGGFEAATPLDDWTTTGTVTAVTNPRHTGTKSALLGSNTCAYPCLTVGEVMPANLYDVDMVADNQGVIHIVGLDPNGGEASYVNRQVTGNWSSIHELSSGSVGRPGLTIDKNGTLHVLWTSNDRVYYTYKPLYGSWTSPVIVANLPQDHISDPIYKVIADGQGGVHVLIERFYYLHRQPGGQWQMLIQQPEYPIVRPYAVMGLDAEDTVHLVWVEYDGEIYPLQEKLLYQQRRADGTWSHEMQLPIRYAPSEDTSIFLEDMVITVNGELHLTWTARTTYPPYHIYHAVRAVNGAWTGPTLVHQNSTPSNYHGPYSRLAADEWGNVHLITVEADAGQSFYRRWRPGSGWQSEIALASMDQVYESPEVIADVYGVVHLLTPGTSTTYHRTAYANTNNTAVLSQQVTIPANMPAPTLAFMAQRPGDVPGDGSGLELLVSEGVTTTAVPLNNGGAAWTHYWADMSAWAGQTVTVEFRLTQVSGDLRVQAAIDDVTLGSAHPDTWVRGNGPGSALPGETVVLRLEYGNNGRVPATAAELALTWPAALTFVSASITPTVAADTLTWDVGDLAAEAAPATVLITATVDPATPFWQTIHLPVSLTSPTAEVEQQNNQAVISVLIAHRLYLPIIVKP